MIESLLWAHVQVMWAEKIIESFIVGPKIWIDSINVVPVLQMKAGPCDYESEPLHLARHHPNLSSKYRQEDDQASLQAFGYQALAACSLLLIRKVHCPSALFVSK